MRRPQRAACPQEPASASFFHASFAGGPACLGVRAARYRLEVSLARQEFNTGQSIAPLGFPGLKVRVAGDAVLDSDNVMPQIAVGIEDKELDSGRFIDAKQFKERVVIQFGEVSGGPCKQAWRRRATQRRLACGG